MSIYMETTKIAPEKSAGEIQKLLMDYGASRILYEYKDRKISGLSFILNIRGTDIPFTLPVRTEPMFKYLQKNRSPSTRQKREIDDKEQAERVAWRQLLRWIQAQFAMIDTGMVETGEVFMPYIQTSGGKTFWEHAIESGKLQLTAPVKEEVQETPEMKIIRNGVE